MALALLLIGMLAGVELTGTAQCPDLSAIAAQLGHLVSRSSASPPDRAVVDENAEGIQLELRRADGTLLGARTLPATGSCDQRAEAIAVTIASWESEIVTSARAVDLPVASAALAVAAKPRAPSLSWDVDVSFLGSIAGSTFAPGMSADVRLGKVGFPLAARIGLAGTDTRDLSVGTGQASWNRWALLIGPTFTPVTRVVHLELHADLVAGWIFIQGRGYANNRGDNAFDPAMGAGTRLSVARWAVTPWIDVTLLGWLRHQNASANEAGTLVSTEVPRFDVWLRAGIAYGRR